MNTNDIVLAIDAEYTGQPEFHWRIGSNDPRDIVWTCTQGRGDAIGTSAHFTLLPADNGRATVLLAHEGWPHDGGNFTKCNTIWGALMHHLKKYAESGVANPALPTMPIEQPPRVPHRADDS